MSYLEHYCSSTILFYCCSFAKLCPTLCDPYPLDCSTPGSSVLHYLPEFAQTHVHWIGDRLLLFFSSLITKCIFCNHITNYILKPRKINLWKSFYVNKNNLLPATYPAKKKLPWHLLPCKASVFLLLSIHSAYIHRHAEGQTTKIKFKKLFPHLLNSYYYHFFLKKHPVFCIHKVFSQDY